jgi:hypothetical protein
MRPGRSNAQPGGMTDTSHVGSSPPLASSPAMLASSLAGVAAVVLSFVGVHVMHPAGAPEHMTDAEVNAWIAPAATQIAAGGSLGVLACLLLLLFAQGWGAQLARWGTAPWVTRLAENSVSVTAAVLGTAALLQVVAGLSALPSEDVAQSSLAATLLNLYGGLAGTAWLLLLPAVLAGTAAFRRAPRRMSVICAAAGVALILCLALPPVSWAVAGAWLTAVLLEGLGTSAAEVRSPTPAPLPRDGA